MRKIIQRNVKGVTLISLIIGTILGAFIILVMLQVFGTSRGNYKLAQNIAEMDNVMRFVGMVVDKIVSQAGYRNIDGTTNALESYTSAFPTFTGSVSGPDGSEYDPGTYPNSDDPAGVVLSYFPGANVFLSSIDPDSQDKLWVKFQGDADGRIRDCNDLYADTATAIRVRFYSRTSSVNGENTTAYYCERQDDGVNYTYSDQTSGTVLIPAQLFGQAWVRYGEDLTGNGYIDRWSLGPDVVDRNYVYAVRFAFLIHTRDDVRAEDATQTFSVFGEEISVTSKKIYKLYMFTVFLKYAPNYALAATVDTP